MITRRRLIWLVAAIVLVFGGWLFTWLRSAEPKHGGHPLSYWLTRTYDPNPSISTEAEEAIRSIGTNALTTLIRWLPERDPKWKLTYNNWVSAIFGYDSYRAEPFLIGRHSWMAADALRIIGPGAKAAIPMLIENMTNHPGSSSSPSSYASALAQIGPEALPPLIGALGSPDPNVREYAIDTLGYFGTNITPVLPKLIGLLPSYDPELKLELINLIGRGKGDERAIATLVTLLEDNAHDVRERAAYSLAYMESAGKPALPKLIAMLQTSNTNLQEAVRFAITKIDTNLVIMGNQVQQRAAPNALR
jgi:hypothetical protein